MWLTAAGIALFFGAIGKSAQFPLHTWLPDAMEGPTPVSSIVHSATMVAAGVYLTARIYPILTPGAHLFIATIGLITLVMAAFMALVMTDIKRVVNNEAVETLTQYRYDEHGQLSAVINRNVMCVFADCRRPRPRRLRRSPRR